MSAEALGARLSKYRLIRLLGSGGMGDVHLAHDPELDRDVAIKFIAPELVSDPAARRRLVREAQAAAGLDHPAICAVYEVVAEPEGRAFIVMQYVEGETLGARLSRGPLEPREALGLAAQVADALAAAHRGGIVHRDLKPDNIIITPSGRPKLLDFGIARITPAAIDPGAETRTSLLDSGSIAGTPAYMSPEQIERKPIDGRTDLFSLGAVLFECLTGRRAFEGHSPIEVCARVLHVHPPPVSSLRPELSEAHDELCRRLLAKDPSDRFQTAEEALGAIRLLRPDTSGGVTGGDGTGSGPIPRPRRRWIGASAVVVTLAIAAGIWIWRSTAPPPPTPEAAGWYARGTELIRDGAYEGARRALDQAIGSTPDFPQAYARLAETLSELDEEDKARDALLQVADPRRFATDDRLRLNAIRALVLRDIDSAVSSYRQLADRRPSDAGVWLDLGRAQEAAGLRSDARASFERALSADTQYAAAHLRIGAIELEEGRRDAALARFDEAERLYLADSSVEGQIETLLRRGMFLSALNELVPARAALEKGITLASSLQNQSQEIRGQLALSSVMASEGQLKAAETLAEKAVKQALDAGLDTVAANGLVDLALTQLDKPAEAARHLDRAVQLSEGRRAPRTLLRAKLQLAALALADDRPADALTLVETTFEGLRTRGYRRWELTALLVASRAREDLGDYARARELAQQVVRAAEGLKDEGQLGGALENLAGQSAAVGLLPEALALRERGAVIYRRQQDVVSLVYDLQNRAEILIRLGRGDEAEILLREIDAGIAAGNDVYATRARRVRLLRALRATIDGRLTEAGRLAAPLAGASGSNADSTSVLAGALLAHAAARGAVAMTALPRPAVRLSPVARRELRYWEIATLLARKDYRSALSGTDALAAEAAAARIDELEWRVAALGASAAAQSGDAARARELSTRARTALARLRSTWNQHTDRYLKRPDLAALLREVDMDISSRSQS